ncbi:MAG: hypothetical protein L3J96_02645 [Thermoplasmata archaeon]|nr:hypothetical protein [Thermoplasmata archaeon]
MEAVGVEIRTLREEVQSLREEQREMAKAIDQLVQTFRTLATHLGIAAEPYKRSTKDRRDQDPPGFA